MLSMTSYRQPAVAKQYCLLTVITALALAAKINASDAAVRKTGFLMLVGLNPKYHSVVLQIINAPSPLKHMTEFVAKLPQHILEMKVASPAIL